MKSFLLSPKMHCIHLPQCYITGFMGRAGRLFAHPPFENLRGPDVIPPYSEMALMCPPPPVGKYLNPEVQYITHKFGVITHPGKTDPYVFNLWNTDRKSSQHERGRQSRLIDSLTAPSTISTATLSSSVLPPYVERSHPSGV